MTVLLAFPQNILFKLKFSPFISYQPNVSMLALKGSIREIANDEHCSKDQFGARSRHDSCE